MLKGVIDEIADPPTDKVVVVASKPVGVDAEGDVSRLLPKGQSSGEVIAGWLPARVGLRWRPNECLRGCVRVAGK